VDIAGRTEEEIGALTGLAPSWMFPLEFASNVALVVSVFCAVSAFVKRGKKF